uniref:Ataxin-10 n=1 Tax=Accipiter nisus TaxID=211598 RepID=A0A8B9NHJ2_9AVES
MAPAVGQPPVQHGSASVCANCSSKLSLISVSLRCSLQFLGNIAAGNGDSQNSIWKCAFPDLFLTCLTYSDEKIVAYCCMVLFTCLNSEKVRELLYPGNLTVALHVLKVYKEQLESEWSFLIVTDHLLKCPELVKALYAKLSNQERVTLLELIMEKVSEKNPVTSEEMNLFMKHADFLAGCFKEKCEAVLKLTSAADAEDEVFPICLGPGTASSDHGELWCVGVIGSVQSCCLKRIVALPVSEGFRCCLFPILQ